MRIQMYHNPRCSKSRQTLELLRERGIEPDVIPYLDTPPSANELAAVLAKLGMRPAQLMRTGEAEYKADREALDGMDEAAQLQWLTEHPRVIQRPIVINGPHARIGRPPESVLEILD